MKGKRILVVDDEPAMLRFLKPTLTATGFEVATVGSVSEALQKIAADTPDIVVLDLGLPDGDGKEVIRRVRCFSNVPIVVLSARDREAEKIAALDLGADDYVNKPFGVGELMARIRTALRHRAHTASEPDVLTVGDLVIDYGRHRVSRGGEPVKLTRKEFDLLTHLARHTGKVLTHRQILSAVWGPAHADNTQYIRVFIGQLRQKVEDRPDDPTLIVTEPGIGYRLVDPTEV